jgi:hypothetical protein
MAVEWWRINREERGGWLARLKSCDPLDTIGHFDEKATPLSS